MSESSKKREGEAGRGQKVIRISNPLNLTSYRMDLFQLRVIMCAIANVKHDEVIDPDKTYFVSASDIIALGTRKQEVYSALKKVSDSLFNGFATIQMSSIKNFPGLQDAFRSSYDLYQKDPSKQIFERFHFLTSVSYSQGHGQIGYRFTPAFIPFVQKLKEQFTEFNLLELTGLRSTFAIRIYTMCLQYQNHPDRTFITTFEDLRSLLDLKEDSYAKFGNFKQRVLDVAVRQINASDYTRFKISLELVRGAHNKVKQVLFHLSPKPFVDTSVWSTAKGGRRAPVLELSDYQATLTARQVNYYADLLAGANPDLAVKKGFKPQEFFQWLKDHKFAPNGHSSAEFTDWLKQKLMTPVFVKKIYIPWLKQLGFKPRKDKAVPVEGEVMDAAPESKESLN